MDQASLQGLTEAEAAKRLQESGFNELPSSKRRSVWHIFFTVLQEPMFLLLVACGTVYFILGDKHEGFMLIGSIFLVLGITVYQERKTEKALEALRQWTSPRALVVRDGRERRIPGREVVPGDIVIVAEGDRVPADAAVLGARSLSVDESLLTGESVPVTKAEWDERKPKARPGGDGSPFVYSGTLVVQGRAVCRVLETGVATEIGKIGTSLQSIEDDRTFLQREVNRLVRIVAVSGAILCIIVLLSYGFMRGEWLTGILAGLSLAMAILPEEFPVVLTIFLALGAWRIARAGALARHVPAVEMLGSATVLCVDKTGTLTMNRMSIRRLQAGENILDVAEEQDGIPEPFHRLLEYGVLASHPDSFDPMEKAIHLLGNRLAGTEHLHGDWTNVKEYPLSASLLAMSEIWSSPNGTDFVVAAKGAPEAILDLCHLRDGAAAPVHRQVEEMSREGLRVLGVAAATFGTDRLPGDQHDFDFRFIGLLGLADPVRPNVQGALAECRTAGIRVVMITGDHPRTAEAIAREIGLLPGGTVVTGPQLEQMNDEQRKRAVSEAAVFARVVPEQKLQIVEALKANGEIVAMTGDGVNDAPALKAAHIGIAMGARGTDVAREASDIVLSDDDFGTIVRGVRMGRRVFDNLRKAMSYILAVHVPIAGIALLPALLGRPLVLTPVIILFMELIIDPACSVLYEMEAEEEDIMRRRPRNPHAPMFDLRRIAICLLQGLGAFAAVLVVYVMAYASGASENAVRTLTFVALMTGNLGLILVNRSWLHTILGSLRLKNPSVFWIVGGDLLVILGILLIPWLQGLFRFAPMPASELLLAAVIGLASIAAMDVMKVVQRSLPALRN